MAINNEEITLNVEPYKPFVIVGEPAGFGEVTASIDDEIGTPSVEVTASGEDTAKNFDFQFHNLKGEPYDDSAIQARMDSFTHLEEGSTTGDAELIDGRIGADGTTYANIGDAVRGQVTDLKSDIKGVIEGYMPVHLGQIIANSYVDNTNGAFTTYGGWSRTDYIDCSGYSQLKIDNINTASRYNAFYNAPFRSSFRPCPAYRALYSRG